MMIETISEKKKMTLEDYFEYEFHSKIRNEFINGKLHPMAYTSPNHGQIVVNFARIIGNCLYNSKSKIFTENRMIFAKGCDNIYYPDVSIFQDEPQAITVKRSMQAFTNPIVLIEILSPSNEDDDRGEKWTCYQKIPSLQQYFLVTQDTFYTEVFNRKSAGSNEWIYTSISDENAKVSIGECEILMKDIYHKVEFPKGEAQSDAK